MSSRFHAGLEVRQRVWVAAAIAIVLVATGCRRSGSNTKPCALADGGYPASFDGVNIPHAGIVAASAKLHGFSRAQASAGQHEKLAPTPHQGCQEAWLVAPGAGSAGRRFSLTAVHYPHMGHAVHRVIYEASARKGTWQATLAVRFDGEDVEQNVFELEFNSTGAVIQLGSTYDHGIDMTRVTMHVPGWKSGGATARQKANREELLRLRSSALSFSKTALERITALEAATRLQLAKGADKCEPDMSQYEGKGIPPPCKPVPMDEAGIAAQRRKADSKFATQKKMIQADAQVMHELLAAMLPADVW